MTDKSLELIKAFTFSKAAPSNEGSRTAMIAIEELKSELQKAEIFKSNLLLLNLGIVLAFCKANEKSLREAVEATTKDKPSQVALHEQVDLWGNIDAFEKLYSDYLDRIVAAKQDSIEHSRAFAEALWRNAEDSYLQVAKAVLRSTKSELAESLLSHICTLININNYRELSGGIVRHLDLNYGS